MVFKDDLFQKFHGLVEANHKEILLMQVINLNIAWIACGLNSTINMYGQDIQTWKLRFVLL
jgi:hypothetical protein